MGCQGRAESQETRITIGNTIVAILTKTVVREEKPCCGQACFCLGDNRHFIIFVPLVLFMSGKQIHPVRAFVKTPSFWANWQGTTARIWGRILGCEFLSPEFRGRILGSNFLALCFLIKRAPSKIHPQEIHRPKFTSENSPQNSG